MWADTDIRLKTTAQGAIIVAVNAHPTVNENHLFYQID